MSKIIPIIMSGGAGQRLWPVSRQAFPKPFMSVGGKPLLEHALERAAGISEQVIIVTNAAHQFASQHILAAMPAAPKTDFLLEPTARNTAPAIALGVLHCLADYGEQAHCLVLAADHIISDMVAFKKAVAAAAAPAEQGALVVFGVRPSAPETGYGYIEADNAGDAPVPIVQFVEKPNFRAATQYLADGRHFWNSGMFYFTAKNMADNLARHAPDIWARAQDIFAASKLQNNVRQFAADDFANLPDISIDYAVMEKADKIVMVPSSFGWSDVGSWDAVAQHQARDENGNNLSERVIHLDSKNTHVESHAYMDRLVATIGLENVAIIDMPDALLVVDRAQAQRVREIVEQLKAGDAFEQQLPNLPPEVQRPWGTYATLKMEAGYQVKRITVYPNQQLSLQYHHKRAEHWVVTQGRAKVQIGDEVFETAAGDYRYIPLGEKHRLTNIGDELLVLIEVQCGDYLGEDDIVRLQDDYGRV